MLINKTTRQRKGLSRCSFALAPLMALLAPVLATGQTADFSGDVGFLSATSGTSNSYPKGDFYAHVTAASGDAPNGCDWGWGCAGSPFRTGPGRCDNWRVGPNWEGNVDGIVLFRKGTDINALIAAADAGGVALPNDADTLTTDFDHGAGIRATLSGHWPQCRGYELMIGYLGLFRWDAGAFNPDVPPSGIIGDQPDLTIQRALSYRSSLHSIEINGQTVSEGLQFFGGTRFVRLSEDLDDIYDEVSPTPSLSTVPVADLELTDIFRNVGVDNNMIGFHGGVRSDLLGIGERFYINGFADAGVYCNLIKRTTTFTQVDTYFRADDPATDAIDESFQTTATDTSGYTSNRARIAFMSEAALNAVYKVNACTEARIGYQVLYINGVELGDEAFLSAAPTSSDLLLHGWFAGVEYRR